MKKYIPGQAKDKSSFFIWAFEYMFCAKLKSFSERLERPKDTQVRKSQKRDEFQRENCKLKI